ncbi:MAG: hypothetical protein ACPG8W_17040 [Candidatus Promineifilaceae bacterium]
MSEDWKNASMIRASEIGEYVFCSRQWWLKRVEGVRPATTARMSAGTRYHQNHLQLVKRAARNEKLIPVIIAALVTLIVLTLLVAFGN